MDTATNNICLVAIDIRSAHNVGSFFRSADGFGADVILVGITPRPKGDLQDDRLPHIQDKTNGNIAKTALGAEKKVNWKYFSNYKEALRALKNEGYKLYAIEQDKSSENLNNLTHNDKIALIVGPELEGLPKDILKLCDKIYEIPMVGSKESYNVAVTAGIALYRATIV